MTGARDVGTTLLLTLAGELPSSLGMSEGRMFNGQGLRVGGSFFAFVSSTGRLVVKLPRGDVLALVEAGEASLVTMGTRTMREWVSLPQPPDGDPARWRSALEAARSFVAAD